MVATQTLDIGPLLNQLTIPGLVAFVIQILKTSNHPWLAWITKDTPWVTRIVAAVAAAGTAVGLSWTYTGGTLTITGIGLVSIVTAIWKVVQTYLLQHVWYRAAFKS